MTRILRIREVVQVTGMSRSAIYRKLSAKQFPEQVRLAPQTVGWRDTDVQAWLESLPANEAKASQ